MMHTAVTPAEHRHQRSYSCTSLRAISATLATIIIAAIVVLVFDVSFVTHHDDNSQWFLAVGNHSAAVLRGHRHQHVATASPPSSKVDVAGHGCSPPPPTPAAPTPRIRVLALSHDMQEAAGAPSSLLRIAEALAAEYPREYSFTAVDMSLSGASSGASSSTDNALVAAWRAVGCLHGPRRTGICEQTDSGFDQPGGIAWQPWQLRSEAVPPNARRLLADHDVVIANTITLAQQLAALPDHVLRRTVWVIRESDFRTYRKQYAGVLKGQAGINLFARPARVVFVANATRALYAEVQSRNNFATIHNWLDLVRVDAQLRELAATRPATQWPGVSNDTLAAVHGRFVITSLGVFSPRKNQLLLLQALSEVLHNASGSPAKGAPPVMLLLVGKTGIVPEYEAMLERFVEDHGLQDSVRMLASTSAIPHLALADLHTSTSTSESLPMNVIEAMAVAVPVLATSVFGVPEIISHGHDGWLVPSGDKAGLVAALRSALAMPGATAVDWQQLGKRGRTTIETRFSAPPAAKRYHQLLHGVLFEAAQVTTAEEEEKEEELVTRGAATALEACDEGSCYDPLKCTV